MCKPKAVFPRKVPPKNNEIAFLVEFMCKPNYDLNIFGYPLTKEQAA
jgi:hypothetical protein